MVDGLGDDPSEGDEASEADSEPYAEGTSSPLEDGGASACDSEDFERSTPDRVSSCGEVAGDDFGSSAGSERLLRSSSVSTMTAIRVPTLTLLEPSGCYTWQISLEVQALQRIAHSLLSWPFAHLLVPPHPFGLCRFQSREAHLQSKKSHLRGS